MGRPTKYSQKVQDEICAQIRDGVRPPVAAGTCDIGRRTFFEWMRDNDAFRTAVERAIDDWEAQATKDVLRGDDQGVGFGRAKATLEVLSRRLPRQWAQQVKHHVETVEDEFFASLEQVCADPNVLARVRQAEDLRVVFAAFCEVLARRESESEASPDPDSSGREAVH